MTTTERKFPWLDFSYYGLRLTVSRDASKGNAAVLVMAGNTEASAGALMRSGFKRTPKGIWYSDRFTDPSGQLRRFTSADFVEQFPALKPRDMTMAEISSGTAARGPGPKVLDRNPVARFIQRVRAEQPQVKLPATLRVMTDYVRTQGGALPMEVRISADGAVEMIEVFNYIPSAKDWVAEHRIRFQDGAPHSAWSKQEGELDAAGFDTLWRTITPRLADSEIVHGVGFSRFYREQAAQRAARTAVATIASARSLGFNSRGEPVYEGAEGRFVMADRGGTQAAVAETMLESGSRFLRAGSPGDVQADNLIECVQGLRLSLGDGEAANRLAYRQAAQIYFGANDEHEELEQLERLVEAAVIASECRDFLHEHRGELHASGEGAARSVSAASRLSRLDSQRGRAHLTPALAMLLGRQVRSGVNGWHLRGIDSPLIAGYLYSRLGIGSVHHADAQTARDHAALYRYALSALSGRSELTTERYSRGVGFAAYFAEESDREIETVPAVLFDELLLRRRDLIEGVRTLAGTADGGTCALVLHSDDPQKPGSIGESGFALQWIADHYQIGTVVDLHPDLFGDDTGDNRNWRRLVICNGRREAPTHQPMPEVQVARNYGELAQIVEANRTKLAALDQDMTARAHKTAMELAEQLGKEKLFENRFQADYVGLSRTAKSETKVPIFLAEAQREAFAKLAVWVEQEGYDSLDELVAARLQLSIEQLSAALGPDQIDAVGLSMFAHARGRAFLNGDQTGVGKGRVLAARILDSINQGVPVMFVTARPGLIRRFWEEIQNVVPADKLVPWIFNDKAPVHYPDGRLADEGRNARIAEAIEHMDATGQLPVNVNGQIPNLFMATAKQFTDAKSNKSKLMGKVSERCMLIIDESHEVAGQSKSGMNFRDFSVRARDVIYSSGTWGQLPTNIHLYGRLFPQTRQFEMDTVEQAIRVGGEPLQEVLATMLVRDGVMTRREHDLSKLDYGVEVDTKRIDESRRYAESFARFANALAVLGHQLSMVRDDLQATIENLSTGGRLSVGAIQVGRNMRITSSGVGQRFYILTRQLLLGINTEIAIDYAIKQAEMGRKPLLMVDATLESLLEVYLEDLKSTKTMAFAEANGLNPEHQKVHAYRDQLDREPVLLDQMPQFSDLLKSVVRTSTAFDLELEQVDGSVRRQRVTLQDLRAHLSSKAQTVYAEIESHLNELIKLAEAFPPMPMSPLDVLRERLQDAGMQVEEITGRTRTLVRQPDGKYLVVNRRDFDRNAQIDHFNNSPNVAAIINRAAFSGFDMHADPRFADTSERVLIGVHEPDNVKDRMQGFGRVFRRNQVSLPKIRTITSSLPAQMRVLAMANQALRKLSASTTGNRQHAALADTVDILNSVGDRATVDFLAQNPALAARLMVRVEYVPGKLQRDGTQSSGRYVAHDLARSAELTNPANAITARLIMLDVPSQEAAYKQLKAAYDALIEQLDDANENPLRVREIDGISTIEKRHQITAGVSAGTTPADKLRQSVFDEPSYLTEISFIRKQRDIGTEADLHKALQRGLASLEQQAPTYQTPPGTLLTTHIADRLRRGRDGYLQRRFDELKAAGRTQAEDLQAAMADPKDLAGADLTSWARRINDLSNLLRQMRIGSVITWREWARPSTGIVTGISVPPASSINVEQMYRVHLYEAEFGHRSMNLSSLTESGMKIEGMQISVGSPVPPQFLRKSRGMPAYAHIVDGNVFLATVEAVQADVGRMPVVYTDAKGTKRHGVLMKKSASPADILNRPIDIGFQGVELLRGLTHKFWSLSARSQTVTRASLDGTSKSDFYTLKVWSDDSAIGADPRLQSLLQEPFTARGKHLFARVSKFAMADVAAYFEYHHGIRWGTSGAHRATFDELMKKVTRQTPAERIRQIDAARAARHGLPLLDDVARQSAAP